MYAGISHSPYLNSSVLSVLSKIYAVHAIRQSVALHPLVGILSALGTNTSDSVNFLEIHLEPLSVVTMPHAPGPAMIQSAVPWCQVMVVIGRGR